MDLKKYTELTGIAVAPEQEAQVKAMIRRAKSKLETLLGYSLKPKNLYTERGKVQYEGHLPILEDVDNLLPSDEVEGDGFKLFNYLEADRFFHVDPFTNVYKVKLVMPVNDMEFITVTDLDNVVKKMERDGIGKFIERHYEWFTWAWYRTYRLSFTSSSDAGLMLAVDAEWVDCYPDDIMYLWADMTTFYCDPNNNIKSESVDGHSWSKADVTAPENKAENQQVLKRYAGPFGKINRVPTR